MASGITVSGIVVDVMMDLIDSEMVAMLVMLEPKWVRTGVRCCLLTTITLRIVVLGKGPFYTWWCNCNQTALSCCRLGIAKRWIDPLESSRAGPPAR
jgi:hypothetical protein